ncbi:MAG: NAD(+) synthase [Oscillospiraceae bacterium]|nr:NAD(+) synthase [Oscillospiraceae bacterium]
MRDYSKEYRRRVEYIAETVSRSGANGIVYGNSGGKDSALVGILCKAACDNTLGLILPCSSDRNYTADATDAMTVARRYGIETRMVDLTPVRVAELAALDGKCAINNRSRINLAPRLRMLTLYAFAAAEDRLVAGTGNRSETYMGYFTKWGDGACDFNPISDLTVTEIYAFLQWLGAPAFLQEKAPSAGLFDSQTDEEEMGVTYATIDQYLLGGPVSPEDRERIDACHRRSFHKLRPISTFENP